MIKYVFIEYRDKAGIGSEVMFDDKTQAVEAAEKEWNHLSDKDKKWGSFAEFTESRNK